jgi:hypothetical protein
MQVLIGGRIKRKEGGMEIIEIADERTDYIIKNSGAINIANQLTCTQRKCWNTMLYFAYPFLKEKDEFEANLNQVKYFCGYRNNNLDDFKKLILEMQGITIHGDLFNKLDEDWSSIQLIGDVAFTKSKTIRWNYSRTMRQFLMSPRIYARLNMDIQRVISGKYALPLWECFVDQLGARRKVALIKINLELLRQILPIQPGQYGAFKDLKRYVIVPAVKEINQQSDILITDITYVRAGRKVARIDFKVEKKGLYKFSKKLSIAPASSPTSLDSLLEQIKEELSLDDTQISQIKSLIFKMSNPLEYLSSCFDYVVQQQNRGLIKKSIKSYFFGILKKGFNSTGVTATPKQISDDLPPTRLPVERDKAYSLYEKLDIEEQETLKQEFHKTLSPSFSIVFETGGLEYGDDGIKERFELFLVKNLLNSPPVQGGIFDS